MEPLALWRRPSWHGDGRGQGLSSSLEVIQPTSEVWKHRRMGAYFFNLLGDPNDPCGEKKGGTQNLRQWLIFQCSWSPTEFRVLELRESLVKDWCSHSGPAKGLAAAENSCPAAVQWEDKQVLFCMVVDNTGFLLMGSSCLPQDHTEITQSACHSSGSSQINKSILFKFVVSTPCWFIAKLKGTQSETINQ